MAREDEDARKQPQGNSGAPQARRGSGSFRDRPRTDGDRERPPADRDRERPRRADGERSHNRGLGSQSPRGDRGGRPSGSSSRTERAPYDRNAGAERRGERPQRDARPSREGGPARDGRPQRDSRPQRDGRPSSDGRPQRDSRPQRDARPARGGGGPERPMRPARDGDRTLAEARAPKIFVPEIPDSIQAADLDRQVKARLRTLSKDNAEDVARHLLMADATLELDPERAYQHAMVAAQRGGRVDVVRECMAITAYATGRYAEALREFRTVRRLNGSNAHLAAMADCERGLGRPERAIALAASDEASSVTGDPLVELRIVVAGARIDMGEPDAAVLILSRLTSADPETTLRIGEAHVEALRAAGRDADADTLQASLPVREIETIDLNEDLIVYDLEEFDVPVEDMDQAHDDEGMTP